MAIRYYAEDIKLPSLRKRETNEWIRAVAGRYGKVCGEISYIFCSDEKILSVNRNYLRHDYYTDVITFDYTENNCLSGDIFISLDTVQSNAALFGSTFGEELYRILIHGVLHLCGINDKTSSEREAMTLKENGALALLPEKLRISIRQLRKIADEI